MQNENQQFNNEKVSYFKFINSLSIQRIIKDWSAGNYSKEELQLRLSTALTSGPLMAACILGFLSIFLLAWCDDPSSCQYHFLGIGVKSLPNLSIIGACIALLNYFVLYKNKLKLVLALNIVSASFAILMFVLLFAVTK